LYIITSLVFGALLYGVVYFQASTGEAFQFIEKLALNSPELDSVVGKVKAVELSPFGSYYEKDVDSDKIVSMAVKVIGELRTGAMQVKMIKTHQQWYIKDVELDGKRFHFDSIYHK
jgi:hypothetical protein